MGTSRFRIKWVKVAFEIDQAVETSVAENSINPQNIEADIRKKATAAHVPGMQSHWRRNGSGQEDC